jgi:NADH dehydrogenase (ubiquinone) Fe-S protein 6
MLSNARSRVAYLLSRRALVSTRRSYAFSANEKQEIKDPNPPKEVPNASKTNELPIETLHRDAPLQEYAEDAEKLGVMQAPNRASIWSRSQNPRAKAMTGPRFEQTIMELQVRESLKLLSTSWAWLYGTLLENWVSIWKMKVNTQANGLA